MLALGPLRSVEEFICDKNFWNKRHILKPGITGVAQLKGDILLEERNKLDLEWVNGFSLRLYFKIIFKTFKKNFKS